MGRIYTDSAGVIADYVQSKEAREEYSAVLDAVEGALSDDAHVMLMHTCNWSMEQEHEFLQLATAVTLGEADVEDWEYGAQLIHEGDFDGRYAKQLCEELGYMSGDLPGFIVIDWDATASNLRVDYQEIEICGETYLAR